MSAQVDSQVSASVEVLDGKRLGDQGEPVEGERLTEWGGTWNTARRRGSKNPRRPMRMLQPVFPPSFSLFLQPQELSRAPSSLG